jgi:hypothetical protein
MKQSPFSLGRGLIVVFLSLFLIACEAENIVREALDLPPANEDPTPVISGDLFTQERAQLVFDANDSSDSDGSIAAYEWSLDTAQFEGAAVELQVDGTLATLLVGEVAQNQTVTLSLRVTDDDGDSATTRVDITIEEVDAARLPPASNDPKATLLGDDVDDDGVRDDMEARILEMYPLSKETREAARQSLTVLSEILAAGDTGTELDVEEVAEKVAKSINCLHSLDAFDYRAYKLLRAMMLDTPERIAAFQAFDGKMSGKVQDTVEAQPGECTLEQN